MVNAKPRAKGAAGLNKTFVLRVRLVAIACVFGALLIVARLYSLQIMNGDAYAARANEQYVLPQTPLIDRNSIFFSTKEGSLLTAATVKAATTTSERKRFYPGGSLAAHAIGFVAYNNDDEQKGRYGLERYYEQRLAGSEEALYRNFFVELFGAARMAFSGEGQSGDLITTLEPSVQAELEQTLKAYDASWSPRMAGGIIMDPKTGEIVAMAVTPTFNLNEFNKVKDVATYGNPLVEGVYEMGSIIKPLTVAAGLDAGVIVPSTTYNDVGRIILDGKPISNHDGQARGVVPMQEILSQSLNLGASFVSMRLGTSTMREYFLERYKLAQETGIDLPGEAHGLVGNLANPRQVEYSTASFGQGIALTPIATVRALATLANGGFLVTPHVVKAVRHKTGVTRELSWSTEQVLKPQTSLEISRMLTKVVDEALVEGKYKIERHSVAAKTGTAQIANPAGGGYYADRFLHSFFGYFPSYDARFIVFLFALEPNGASFASQTLAAPFHSLTEFLINYYAIPPDR